MCEVEYGSFSGRVVMYVWSARGNKQTNEQTRASWVRASLSELQYLQVMTDYIYIYTIIYIYIYSSEILRDEVS